MDPCTQLIHVELAIAILIHHAEEGIEDNAEVLLGITRHLDTFGLLGIRRWHDHQHGGMITAALVTVAKGIGHGQAQADGQQ